MGFVYEMEKKREAAAQKGKTKEPVREKAAKVEKVREAIAAKDDGKRIPVSLKMHPEVIDYFKADGPRWQTRINDVLLEYVRGQGRVAK